MPPKGVSQKTVPAFERINSFQKLLICIAIAIVVYFIVEVKKMDALTHIMIGWVTFSLCMITMSWITFIIINSDQMRAQAKIQDPNRAAVFMILLVATIASFSTVLILIVSKSDANNSSVYKTPIAVIGMLLSWFLIHTIFALRYAHIYYGDHETKPNTHAAGLNFPDDDEPDYLDFAYFSFVLGMTFQVSDVEIASKKFRKMALAHGLISFAFSTIMISLTINLIAGH